MPENDHAIRTGTANICRDTTDTTRMKQHYHVERWQAGEWRRTPWVYSERQHAWNQAGSRAESGARLVICSQNCAPSNRRLARR